MSRQLDAAIRHHAMESGAFVVNATGWLTDEQRAEIAPDESLRKVLQGGNCTAVVSPWGEYLAGPLQEGEGMAIAEIDLQEISGIKNILDTAGHYSRPDILKLKLNDTPQNSVEKMSLGFPEIHDGISEDLGDETSQ
jgi:nitrilase